MKRGESGLSLVVGINKPASMTSHDVVNACRRIFGERRVGHMGTLDPLATGVLPIGVGPATRLNAYLSDHDKNYRVTMTFGSETDTDDATGSVTRTAPVPADMLAGDFADAYIEGLVGDHMQTPPDYSAIKQQGVKAYEAARQGKKLDLESRPIQIFSSKLIERYQDSQSNDVCWVLDLHVSKGTYIRSIVRDIGRELGCLAHVSALERTKMGMLNLDRCVSLETLERLGTQAALDPIKLLGVRFAYGDAFTKIVENGNKLSLNQMELYELTPETIAGFDSYCACCTSTTIPATEPPANDELVGIVVKNKLKALYSYDADCVEYRSKCIFAEPIIRTHIS